MTLAVAGCGDDPVELGPDEETPVTPGYRLSLNPTHLVVAPGELGISILTVHREAGFSGFVAPSAMGTPAWATVELLPRKVSDSYAVRITVAPHAPSGSAEITFVSNAGAAAPALSDRLLLTVEEPMVVGSCVSRLSGGRVVFVAAQDGSEGWRSISGADDIQALDWPTGRGAIASVHAVKIDRGDELVPEYRTNVFLGTRDELVGLVRGCGLADAAAVPVEGRIANAGGAALVTGPSGELLVQPPHTGFALNLRSSPSDVVALVHRASTGGRESGSRAVIRRGVTASPEQLLDVFDLDGPESFDLVRRRTTISRAEQVDFSAEFRTFNGTVAKLTCVYEDPWWHPYRCDNLAFTEYPGVPNPRDGEAHRLIFTAIDRWVMKCSKYAEEWAASLPPRLGPVEVDPTSAGGFRLWYRRQPEYQGAVVAQFSDFRELSWRRLRLHLSSEYLGSSSVVDFVTPDLSTISGWNPDWGLRNTDVAFQFQAQGWGTDGDAPCGGVDFFGASWQPDTFASELRAAWVTFDLRG